MTKFSTLPTLFTVEVNVRSLNFESSAKEPVKAPTFLRTEDVDTRHRPSVDLSAPSGEIGDGSKMVFKLGGHRSVLGPVT